MRMSARLVLLTWWSRGVRLVAPPHTCPEKKFFMGWYGSEMDRGGGGPNELALRESKTL